MLRGRLFACSLILAACQGSDGVVTDGALTLATFTSGEQTGDGSTGGGPGETTGDPAAPTTTQAASTSSTASSSTTDDVPAVCGDGVLGGAEECDDGDANGPGAACKADCSANVCGDADVGPGEACDDGASNGDDDSPCASHCALNVCGDGERGPGEACDNGRDNAVTGKCLPDCTVNVCGDGFVGPDEYCDDANDVNTDACTNGCKLPTCGDGILSPPEACDDGDLDNDDGCDENCALELCGDGYLDPGEDCDDFADGDPDDGCTASCKFPACGDGYDQPSLGEQCDDGNGSNSDDCVAGCKYAKCGDGYVSTTMDNPEPCDDGNQSWDDFCNPYCTRPKRVFVTSTTYDGNLGNNDGAHEKCQARADAAGLGGAWHAWISANRPADFDLPASSHVARLDMISISTEFEGIFKLNILAPINVDEFGQPLPNAQVWTHTRTDGQRDTSNDDTMGCSNFTSNHPNRFATYGTTAAMDKTRTQAGSASCAEKKHLYCFDKEHYKP